MLRWLLALMFCSMANAEAGDRSSYNLLGFSADGKYVAFERYGEHDGSAAPYCTIFIVEVAANDYAVAPVEVLLDPMEEKSPGDARALALQSSNSFLKKFGIEKEKTGRSLWQAKAGASTDRVNFVWRKQIAELTLVETEIDRDCEPAGSGRIFELGIRYEDGASQVLQKDTVLPESRGCAFSYRLEEVIRYEKSIAVFVNISSVGFEGPNERQIIVTGVLWD